jgi:asparagine synthase (glutamine-hydrolysing)
MSRPATLSPIEIATGLVFGGEPRPLPPGVTMQPAAALQAAVRPAVQTGRCFVSFSGGRDSSAVLATAAATARRESLPPPVPVTIRASDVPSAYESDWQESVVRHLGLSDWIRLEIRDELDAVGPYAQRALARHGLVWPFNAHFHLPMLEQAAGGTLLTGVGGDELWMSSRASPVTRRRRLLQLAPVPVRRAALTRRVPSEIEFPWLRPRGRRKARRVAAAEMVTAPATTHERMPEALGSRALAIGTASLDTLAADMAAGISHPLLDGGVWAAVAAAAPRAGFDQDAAALAALAGHLLPGELVARRSKASFNGLFFHDHSRALAREWTGGGVPADLVDERLLREHWQTDAVDAHSLTLLQSLWLASARDRFDEAGSRVAH